MFWKKKEKKKNLPAEEERRIEPRLDDHSEISIELEAEEPGRRTRLYYGRAKDASPSGLRVQTDVQFPISTRIDIKLQSTRTGKLIQAKGIVKWVRFLKDQRCYEIGIEFAETPVKTIMEIIDHIYRA